MVIVGACGTASSGLQHTCASSGLECGIIYTRRWSRSAHAWGGWATGTQTAVWSVGAVMLLAAHAPTQAVAAARAAVLGTTRLRR